MEKQNNIQKVLNSFVNNLEKKAILIDGSWGSGKTYEVNEFIKHYNNVYTGQNRIMAFFRKIGNIFKKNKIYYISVFGLDSIDEINTILYKQTKKISYNLKKEAIVLTKAISAIPRLPDLTEALSYQLHSESNIKIKKHSIVVLDDLERLSNNIEYTDLMGYINSLFLSGCRFICLMSTSNLKTHRLENFNEFKEKVFDELYSIENLNNKVLDDMFEDFSIEDFANNYYLFNSNIRFAQKVRVFYSEIIKHVSESKKSCIDFGNLALLKASIIAISVCFNTYKIEIKKDDIYYKELQESFDEDIAIGVMHFRQNENYKIDFHMPFFYDILKALIKAFKYKNYNAFDKVFFKTDENIDNDSILSEQYYFLSDEKKKKYIDEFLKVINNSNTWKDSFRENLRAILLNSKYVFNENQTKKIARLMASSDDNLSLGVLWNLGIDSNDAKERNKLFFKNIDNYIKELKGRDFVDNFIETLNDMNYEKLVTILEGVGKCSSLDKMFFLDYIVSNNFLLPDISGDISYDMWSYCHAMARFAKKNDKGQEFINTLKELHKGDKTESELDRCFALVYYNIDNQILDEDLV